MRAHMGSPLLHCNCNKQLDPRECVWCPQPATSNSHDAPIRALSGAFSAVCSAAHLPTICDPLLRSLAALELEQSIVQSYPTCRTWFRRSTRASLLSLVVAQVRRGRLALWSGPPLAYITDVSKAMAMRTSLAKLQVAFLVQ